jgi:hypothetical protein
MAGEHSQSQLIQLGLDNSRGRLPSPPPPPTSSGDWAQDIGDGEGDGRASAQY